MPSPVAHSLAGFAVAHFALRSRLGFFREQRASRLSDSPSQTLSWFAAFAFAANAADLDFLPGFLIGDPNRFHHGPSHTLLAAFVFGILTSALARVARFEPWRRLGLLMGLGYSTHLLLDFMSRGSQSSRYGMQILWPFSSRLWAPPFHLFLDIRRDGQTTTFVPSLWQWHNMEAIALELAVMAAGWMVYCFLSSLQVNLSDNGPGRGSPS